MTPEGAAPWATPPRPSLLVVDFDETCTEGDTTALLVEACTEAAARAAGGHSAAARLREARRVGTEAALSIHARGKAALYRELEGAEELGAGATGAALPRRPPREFDAGLFELATERLAGLERDANAEAERRELVRGATREQVLAVARRVRLHPGCSAALGGALRAGVPTVVLSANWSTDLVREVLRSHGLETERYEAGALTANVPGGADTAAGTLPARRPLLVRANELEYGEGAGLVPREAATPASRGDRPASGRPAVPTTTGRVLKSIECGADKREAMDGFLRDLGLRARGPGRRGISSVYVGDSVSDLPAALRADLSVVLGGSADVSRLASSTGLTFEPIGRAAEGGAQAPGQLSEAKSWDELSNALFGGAGTAPAGEGARSGGSAVPGGPARPSPDEGDVVRAVAVPARGRRPPRILVVAGSDSCGGAGAEMDQRAALLLGAHAGVALTALTAQNSEGVHAVHAVPPAFFGKAAQVVLDDLGADAIKIGMVPSARAADEVAAIVRHWRDGRERAGRAPGEGREGSSRGSLRPRSPVVLDPVMVSTSGHDLGEAGQTEALLRSLVPLATVLTPNLPEAQRLLGWAEPIKSVAGMRAAAVALRAYGPEWVLVKGGHLVAQAGRGGESGSARRGRREEPGSDLRAEGDDQAVEPAEVTDVLFDGQSLLELCSPAVAATNSHGTGCCLAAGIAARLAAGDTVPKAVLAASAFVRHALSASRGVDLGRGAQRCMDLSATPAGPVDGEELPGGQRPPPGAAAAPVPDAPLPGRALNPVDLRVYAVTDPGCNARAGRTMAEAVLEALEGGATIVQVREKEGGAGAFCATAAEALAMCRAWGVPLVVNDRVDVALAIGADGAHVGQGDVGAAAARRLLGPHRILGVSAATPDEVRAAFEAGADYVGVGAVHPTGTKADAGEAIGLSGLAACAAEASRILGPSGRSRVVAIGGLTREGVAGVLEAGAGGVAVVSAIFAAPDARAAAKAIRLEVDRVASGGG